MYIRIKQTHMSKIVEPIPVEKIRKTKYPFLTMEVGDTFEVEGVDEKTPATQDDSQKVSRAVVAFRFRNKKNKVNRGKEFSVQLYTDGKYRCKRTK